MKQVTVNLPEETISQIEYLANQNGIVLGEFYRQCLILGATHWAERFTKNEVYKSTKRRNIRQD